MVSPRFFLALQQLLDAAVSVLVPMGSCVSGFSLLATIFGLLSPSRSITVVLPGAAVLVLVMVPVFLGSSLFMLLRRLRLLLLLEEEEEDVVVESSPPPNKAPSSWTEDVVRDEAFLRLLRMVPTLLLLLLLDSERVTALVLILG